MVQALYDEQAGVAIFPFGKLECALRIGAVPVGAEEFFGRELIVIKKDEMPQSGTLFRCVEHGAFLVTGITTQSQLRCNGKTLAAGSGISVPSSTQLGKRYMDPQSGMETLCIKKGGDNEVPVLPQEPLAASKKYENVEGGAVMICTKGGDSTFFVAARPLWETVPKVLPSAD